MAFALRKQRENSKWAQPIKTPRPASCDVPCKVPYLEGSITFLDSSTIEDQVLNPWAYVAIHIQIVAFCLWSPLAHGHLMMQNAFSPTSRVLVI